MGKGHCQCIAWLQHRGCSPHGDPAVILPSTLCRSALSRCRRSDLRVDGTFQMANGVTGFLHPTGGSRSRVGGRDVRSESRECEPDDGYAAADGLASDRAAAHRSRERIRCCILTVLGESLTLASFPGTLVIMPPCLLYAPSLHGLRWQVARAAFLFLLARFQEKITSL
jgi:hypothetical protein